jgi:Xaa-Pro aminopeptidase
MTFAFEPRVFLTGIGVLGIEDTFVLTEEGPEQITITDREIKVLDLGG